MPIFLPIGTSCCTIFDWLLFRRWIFFILERRRRSFILGRFRCIREKEVENQSRKIRLTFHSAVHHMFWREKKWNWFLFFFGLDGPIENWFAVLTRITIPDSELRSQLLFFDPKRKTSWDYLHHRQPFSQPSIAYYLNKYNYYSAKTDNFLLTFLTTMVCLLDV